MTQKTKLGYIGLGQMGAAMAERLLGDDAELHVFDTSSEAMNRFTARGAIGHARTRRSAAVSRRPRAKFGAA